jgi:hypothetical protein
LPGVLDGIISLTIFMNIMVLVLHLIILIP